MHGVSIASSAVTDRQSGVGVEGLSGGIRCANALALADGEPLREEPGGEEGKLPLRARFLGGDTDEKMADGE